MIGPKLDARTYAIFILALMGAAISVGLVAQSQDSGVTSSADVSASTREVAAATREVAESNRAIAESLREVAEAIRSVQTTMEKQTKGSAVAQETTSDAGASAAPAEDETMISPDSDEPPAAMEKEPPVRGVFEIKR